MKILFISDNFTPERNATASRVYERACYWVKQGHHVTVITAAPNLDGKLLHGYKNKWYQSEDIEGVHVIRVKTFIAENKGFFLRSLDYISYLIPSLVAALFQKKPDVILATCPLPFAALSGYLTSILKRIPFVLEVSDLWPASILAVGAMRESFIIKCLEKLELFLYRKSDQIIVLTSAFKTNLIKRGINSHKIDVVINGVDIVRYSPRIRNENLMHKYQLDNKSFIVGYIGTFGMAHALMNVLWAAEILITMPEIRFILVGSGADKIKLKKFLKTTSINNVLIIESQPKSDIPEYWSLCDVALVHLKNSPVFSEVLPSKIFESIGMGIPLIVSAPPGEATQFVTENNIGISVDPENPKKLADTIQYYRENKPILRKHAENCLNIRHKHTREKQAQRLITILSNVLEREKMSLSNE